MDRFWSKVNSPLGVGECWEWIAHKNHKGYGQFRFKSKMVRAHRFAYELVIGKIPQGLTIDHLCSNRACVNPYHMEPVTQKVNTFRGNTINSINMKKTHCPRGHELKGTNLNKYDIKKGHRICRICKNDKSAKSRRLKGIPIRVMHHG